MSEKKFEPQWNNAQVCPKCKELGMSVWQESSTARMCANCKFIEERTSQTEERKWNVKK